VKGCCDAVTIRIATCTPAASFQGWNAKVEAVR
jgi:hypothetical protein